MANMANKGALPKGVFFSNGTLYEPTRTRKLPPYRYKSELERFPGRNRFPGGRSAPQPRFGKLPLPKKVWNRLGQGAINTAAAFESVPLYENMLDAYAGQFLPGYREQFWEDWAILNGYSLPMYEFMFTSPTCTQRNAATSPFRYVPPGNGGNLVDHKIKLGGDATCGASLHTGTTVVYGTPVVKPAGVVHLDDEWGEVGFPAPSPFGHTVASYPVPTAARTYNPIPATRVKPITRTQGLVQMEPAREPMPQPQGKGLRRYQSFAMSVTLEPGKRPVKNPDDVHNHVKPGKGEKEDKPYDEGKSIKEVYGALTEINDVLDCMEKSMKNRSKEYRKERPNERAVPVNKRFDLRFNRLVREAVGGNIDWQKFVNCMALSNAKDAAIGGLSGSAIKRLNRSPYAPRGRAYRGYGVGMGSMRMR